MRKLWFLPLVLLVLAVATVGCGSPRDDNPTTTTTGANSTTTTGGQATIPDGTHFGFVRQVADDVLMFDPADFLTGEAALAAARDAGAIGPDEDLPNDFYIDNPDEEQSRLEVGAAAPITLIVAGGTTALSQEIVSYDDLIRLWNGADDANRYYGFVVGELPMTLTVTGGAVVEAVQTYLP